MFMARIFTQHNIPIPSFIAAFLVFDLIDILAMVDLFTAHIDFLQIVRFLLLLISAHPDIIVFELRL